MRFVSDISGPHPVMEFNRPHAILSVKVGKLQAQGGFMMSENHHRASHEIHSNTWDSSENIDRFFIENDTYKCGVRTIRLVLKEGSSR